MDNNEKINKGIIIFILIVAICILCSLDSQATEIGEAPIQNEYTGILRFHVIANSNLEEDQQLKLKVRDVVFEKIEHRITHAIITEMEEEGTSEVDQSAIAHMYIESHLEEINQWANTVIIEEGYDYQVTSKLGICGIPEKEYDGIYFPAGNYEALTISIGEAKGKNWWCVIFPPLCLIDSENSAYQDQFQIDEDGRLVLKSKIGEILKAKKKKDSAV